MRDEALMREALREAARALQHDDVPVGALVVRGDEILGRGRNRREADGDPTAHAEMLAIREASRALGMWRLEGCELFVTLEPCAMCAGAAVLARIARIVYATEDPKAGACGSVLEVAREERLNHRIEVVGGVLREEAAEQLRGFFRALRRREGEGRV